MEIFAQLIFPIFGLLIILFAIGAFFFSYGQQIKEATQKIELFGARLEISIITAIILAGMIFCGIGIYLNETGYRKRYNDISKKIDDLNTNIATLSSQKQEITDALNRFKVQSISYRFTLDDLNDNMPPPPACSLNCVYYKSWDKSDSITYRVFPAGSRSYRVTFNDLSEQQLTDASPVVYLVNNKTRQRWVATSFNPLTPYLSLSPENKQ